MSKIINSYSFSVIYNVSGKDFYCPSVWRYKVINVYIINFSSSNIQYTKNYIANGDQNKTLSFVDTLIKFHVNIDNAIQHYNSAPTVHSKGQGSYINLGIDYKNTDVHEAIKHFNTNINLQPNNIKAYEELSALYRELKKYDLALKCMKKASKYVELDDEHFFCMALDYSHLGQINNSNDYFQKVIQINPKYHMAYFHLARNHMNPLKGYKEACLDPSKDIPYSMGNCDVDKNSPKEAIDYYNKFIDSVTDKDYKILGLIGLAASYGALKNFKKNIEILEYIKSIDPNNVNSYIDLSITFLKLGRYDDAYNNIKDIERIDPNNQFINKLYGDYYRDQKKYDEAISYYNNQLQRTPRMSEIHTSMSACYFQKRNLLLAYKWTKSADKLQKGSAIIQDNLRMIYAELSKYGIQITWLANALDQKDDLVQDFFDCKSEDVTSKDIIQWYKDFLSLNPNDSVAHNNIASEYFRAESFEEALKHYKCAIEFNLPFPDTYYNLGIIHIIRGDSDLAKSAFTNYKNLSKYFDSEQFKISPFYSEVFTDGLVCLSNGNTDLAIDAFTKLISQHGNTIELYWFRAEAYELAGNRKGKKHDLDVIEEHRPELINLSAESMYSRMAFSFNNVDEIKKLCSEEKIIDFEKMQALNEAKSYFNQCV